MWIHRLTVFETFYNRCAAQTGYLSVCVQRYLYAVENRLFLLSLSFFTWKRDTVVNGFVMFFVLRTARRVSMYRAQRKLQVLIFFICTFSCCGAPWRLKKQRIDVWRSSFRSLWRHSDLRAHDEDRGIASSPLLSPREFYSAQGHPLPITWDLGKMTRISTFDNDTFPNLLDKTNWCFFLSFFHYENITTICMSGVLARQIKIDSFSCKVKICLVCSLSLSLCSSIGEWRH